jgi:hypothetical protein
VIAGKVLRNLGGLLIVWAVCCAPRAQAATLWYNGDQDGRDAISNETATSASGVDGAVYDDFIVPFGQKWTITSVWSNNVEDPFFSSPSVKSVAWSIRSGVSAGHGGTVVASGSTTSGNTTETADGTSVVYAPFPANQVTTTGKGMSVVLTAGTYWLSVAPVTTGTDASFFAVSTTSGTNAVGSPPGDDGKSYFFSNALGDNFVPTSTLEAYLGEGSTWDYSMGVAGTFVVSPEPSSMVLMLAACFGLPALGFRRRKNSSVVEATV